MTDDYMTVNEAAVELEVSRATAWKWIKRHEIQTYRFMGDRKTYVRSEDVEVLKKPVPVDYQKNKRPD